MKNFLILIIPFLSCCNYNQEPKGTIIDIHKEYKNDSLNNSKDVIVTNSYFESIGGNAYFVDIYFDSNDTLRSAKIFLGDDNIYNKANYHWVSDTSLHITLYDSEGDSSVSFFAGGTMDGKGSSISIE